MTERRRLFTRRTVLKGFFAATAALGEIALFPSLAYGPGVDPKSFDPTPAAASSSEGLTELGNRTIEEAIRACEIRRRQFPIGGRPSLSTLLAEVLDTSLAQSKKIGLRNAHHWDEHEMLDWHAPFAFAVNPNAASVNGKTIWFANTPTVAIFRRDPFGNSLEHMENRMIWAMHKGAEALVVVEIEDDEGVANLAELTTLLVKLGVKTIVVGNEPDSDPDDMDRRYVPQRIYKAGIIIANTLAQLRKNNVNIALPAVAFDQGYGKSTRKLYQDVAACGDYFPFNVISYHYYGPAEDFPAWTRNEVESYTGNIPGVSHHLTEVGLPLAIMSSPDHTTDRVFVGTTAKILAVTGASSFFSKVYYHALLDGANEKHSLAHVSSHNLAPNISYVAYQNIVKLFTNPVGKPELIEERNIMGACGRRARNDGGIQDFSVLWSRKPTDIIIPSSNILEKPAMVFDIFGQPTGEINMITLTPQSPKILVTKAS